MARVKRAVNAHKKRRVVLERASGYRGQRSRLYRKAKEQLLHSFNYNFRDRKARKGDFRKLWIQRINAAVRAEGITYNRDIDYIYIFYLLNILFIFHLFFQHFSEFMLLFSFFVF